MQNINRNNNNVMDVNLEIRKIKQLRKEVYDIIQEVKSLDNCREVQICMTKLQEADMWLGMDLKRIGAINPYPNSKDSSTGTEIEDTCNTLK